MMSAGKSLSKGGSKALFNATSGVHKVNNGQVKRGGGRL